MPLDNKKGSRGVETWSLSVAAAGFTEKSMRGHGCWRLLQISCEGEKPGHVVFSVAKRSVAQMTQDPSDFVGLVIVICVPASFPAWIGALAYGATSALSLKQCFPLFKAHCVSGPQMLFAA
jgi:hypothetical protein